MDVNFAVTTRSLTKEFTRDASRVTALKQVTLSIAQGEFVALMGPSGSGKSTLLHLIAGMDSPTSGDTIVFGKRISDLSKRELGAWRNEHVGFIFQNFNLVPVLTAFENVELPLRLTRLTKKERNRHAVAALSLVGLSDRLRHRPRQLSGGQEQRVAIARAIATDPKLVLADEPTGNLDSESATDILTLLSRLNEEHGKTIVMVTHDPHAASFASRICHLEKGELSASETKDNIGIHQASCS